MLGDKNATSLCSQNISTLLLSLLFNWSISTLTRNQINEFQVIGRLELGGDKCEGTALHHWNEVLASPRRQIAEWHKLRE